MTASDNNSRRHPSSSGSQVPVMMRYIFGIFMILVYVGVGVGILFFNIFKWDASFNLVRYVGGAILIVYGFWRAYRQIKGPQFGDEDDED